VVVAMTVPSEVIWIFVVYPDQRGSIFAGQALNTGQRRHKRHRCDGCHDGSQAQQVHATYALVTVRARSSTSWILRKVCTALTATVVNMMTLAKATAESSWDRNCTMLSGS